MSRVKRTSAAGASPAPVSARARGLTAAAIVLTIALGAGCSADVTRFGFLDGPQSPPDKEKKYAPPGSGYQTGGHGTSKGVKESSLPPVDKASKAPDAPSGPPSWHIKTADVGAKTTYAPSPWSWANRSQPKEKGKPLWTDEEPFPWPDAPPKEKAPKSSFQGHYTMRRGDTLEGVAVRYKVSLAELKRVNGIADQTKVKVGTVLAIPARGTGVAPPPLAPPRVVQVKPVTGPPPDSKVTSLVPPKPVPVPKAVRESELKSSAETEKAEATAAVKFRWPVAGKLISRFGPQADGSKNEGIKLAVPLGTDIHAAESGRVHYAGDGLKGYGNLILIRHPNGWVSTYAHADKMLVKVGDQVKRGQVIGKTGKTGPVGEPQLGFELRKGSVPVNPLEHLAKN
jgi:murein DD-endopeptidase MepM/ murein hydrolase activator NlpD